MMLQNCYDAKSPQFVRLLRRAAREGFHCEIAPWMPLSNSHLHSADTLADLAHEYAHWLLAAPERRMLNDFGLGLPGSRNEAWQSEEEHRASLLGIAIALEYSGDDEYVGWIFRDHGWDDVGTVAEYAEEIEVALPMSRRRLRALRRIVRRA